MNYRHLYLFIEGFNDKLFFENIIIPILRNNYDYIDLWSFSSKSKDKIKKLITNIENQNNDYLSTDYLFITDLDYCQCINERKNKIQIKYPYIENKIVVVVCEIESWYLSGLNDKISRQLQLKLNKITNYEKITKEDFERMIIKHESIRNIRKEITMHFDISLARKNNKSFDYFCKKYLD